MASSGLTGDDDGAPIFDSLAKFYTSVAIVWTVVIATGAGLLIANRHEQYIRIRNLSLVLSAVGCLHVYWILCLVAYSMNGKYPCVAEYWVMSIYLPLGIALFQANSMQLLSVFGIQQKLLLATHRPYVPRLTDRTSSSGRWLDKWRQWNLVQRTEFGIVVGMIVQVSTYALKRARPVGHEAFQIFSSNIDIVSIVNSGALYLPHLTKISNVRHLGCAGQSLGMSTRAGMVSPPHKPWKYTMCPLNCSDQEGSQDSIYPLAINMVVAICAIRLVEDTRYPRCPPLATPDHHLPDR